MSTEDRRAPGAARIPFEALVEVGGALGPSFEAQAVDISEDGMQMRTAYLPETGQPLTCRFDGGPGQSVLASGEVVWAHGADRGGEFAVRFTDMDAESVDSLKRICGVDRPKPVQPGAKVRLHIEGLASPMRAKIRDAHTSAVTVGSDLGFLQVGRQLELEDSHSGDKRPACIDRVDVTVDPTSHVPQLVVTLRYADVAPAEAPSAPVGMGRSAVDPPRQGDDLAAVEQASAQMKSAFARNAARVGPAIMQLAKRAATTATLLARRRGRGDDAGPRRTTAPAPGGGLHTSGRRVVRGDTASASDARKSQEGEEASSTPRSAKSTRRRALIAGSVMSAAIAGAIVMKKVHHEPAAPPPGAAAVESAASVVAAAGEPAAPLAAPPITAGPAAPEPGAALATTAYGDDGADTAAKHKKHPRVAPFGNGPVHHGNVLHLKMDAPIESIEGAQQPTGFTVKLPGRRSLEAAAPLAARDSRIAAIKVSNDSAGAELTVNFKDGVPNYQVSAHNDTLSIALAPVGLLEETTAKKDDKGTKAPKHARHEREHEARGNADER